MRSGTQVESYKGRVTGNGGSTEKGELEDTFSQGLHFLHEQKAGSPLRVNGAGVG